MDMSSGLYEYSGDNVSQEYEYANWEKPRNPRNISNQELQRSGDASWSRRSRLTAVSVVLLCVLLLSVIIVLSVNLIDRTRERNQLQISYDNMTAEREQLQTERDGFQKMLKRNSTLQSRAYPSSDTDYSLQQCYSYFITKEKKNWKDARVDCSSRGADLVIINSREEQELISKRFVGTEAWIGLTDTTEEGTWKWVDGTALTSGYWWDGEPNDYDHDEDCAVTGSRFAKDELNTWADYPCHIHLLAICKIRA